MADLKDLTPEEMARVKMLDAAATPGPWTGAYDEDRDVDQVVAVDDLPGACVVAEEVRQGTHDAALIAEYRSLAPRMAAQIERLQSQRCETCRFVGRNDFGEPHVYFSGKGERSYGCEYGGHHFVPLSHGCTAHAPKEPR